MIFFSQCPYGLHKSACYSYNVSGRRSAKTVNGTVTNQIWDGQNIVRETNGSDTEIAKYYRGSRLVAQKSGTAVSYYTYDAHGSVAAMNGQGYEYDAYGNLLENGVTSRNPFRYNGEYYDEETGMIYLRARYYDSSIGRFVSEDTHWNPSNMIYGDNPRENPVPDIAAILQSGNLYVYCLNDPINRIDPSGEWNRELRDILNKYTWQDATQVFDASNRARDNAVNKANAAGADKTWDNEFDAMRHFQWNAVMTREINYEVAKFAANNHEIYGLVDAGFYRSENGNMIRTRMNQATLMDLWNNSVGRTLGADNNLDYMNYDDLFYYAANNGMLILDVNSTYEKLGIQSYVRESDWTVGVDWNLETGNVTIMKEGLPNITLKVGI